MKKIFLFILTLSLSFSAGYFLKIRAKKKVQIPEAKEKIVASNLHQATLKVEGMTCSSCSVSAQYALEDKEGVVRASINYENGNGTVIYDPKKISLDEIVQTIKPYAATVLKDVLFNTK